jgi:hypothetical protein
VNAAERQLGRILSRLESATFDAIGLEEACRELDAGLKDLPSAGRQRTFALHAAVRAEVDRKRAEIARSLAVVVSARERLARLTRPEDSRSALDLDA